VVAVVVVVDLLNVDGACRNSNPFDATEEEKEVAVAVDLLNVDGACHNSNPFDATKEEEVEVVVNRPTIIPTVGVPFGVVRAA
jgi:hypothetical protein